jgi:hypothetical protein
MIIKAVFGESNRITTISEKNRKSKDQGLGIILAHKIWFQILKGLEILIIQGKPL